LKGAESGNAACATNLGQCYEHGIGVPQDHKAALNWTRKGAELGDPVAVRNLQAYDPPTNAESATVARGGRGETAGLHRVGYDVDRCLVCNAKRSAAAQR